MPRLMACSHSRDDPASRFRVLQYLPHLEAAGWTVEHRPNRPSRYFRPGARLRLARSIERRAAIAARRLSRLRDVIDAARFDAVFLNRDLLEGDIAWERRLFARNPRVVFDFDDAIFLGPKREAHIGWICSKARWVTAGNEHLAAFARRYTDRVTVLPTVVETERYVTRAELDLEEPGEVPPARLRVGWLGSDLSIRETLFPHWEMLGRLQERLDFDFVVCSRPEPVPPSNAVRWRYVVWSPETETEIARHIDIGIMPLVDNAYQRGKCGLKLLQYMAAGLPVVASPIGVNRTIIGDGTTGFLADGEAEWSDALAALLRSPRLRQSLGAAGRLACETHYDLRLWLPTLLAILERAARPDAA